MRMRIPAILLTSATVLFSGCATKVLQSDQFGVVTDSFTPNYTEAKQVADIECAKYNRSAIMKSGVNAFDRKVTFECVNNEKKNDSLDNVKTSSDRYSELKKLKELLDIGAITSQEFETQKSKILGK